MCWWAYLGLLCLFSYLFLAFKLFITDYRETKEQGINPEYSDIRMMLIMAVLWPVYAVIMVWDDLFFALRKRGEEMKEFYRKIAQLFCKHRWWLEFVKYGITNELCSVYICRKCGKRRIEK